jgi:tripartite ATP-independent transporter DctP family solute receptor
MKTIRWMLGTALLAFAAHAPLAQPAPLRLTYAHGAVINHPSHQAALRFAQRVEARSNGSIQLELFPAGEFGSAYEVLQKVKIGTIDMDTVPADFLFRYEKAFAVVAMPYLFDSYEHAHRVLDGPAKSWFAALAEKQGFVILSNWEWGFRNITNNKHPVNTPEDMRGLKIRVPAASGSEGVMTALGAQTSDINVVELYLALSQGVVDGQENPLNIIYSRKLFEVQKHLALTRHVYYPAFHLMSARTWAKLTPAQQKIVREESKAAGDWMRQRVMAEEDELVTKMVKAGVAVTRPDPRPFSALMAPVRQQAMRRSGEDNVQKFLKMVDDERRR